VTTLPSELQELLGKLSPQQQRLAACDCAEHVLPYFERFQPQDKRPRLAIDLARQYALGKATPEELKKAGGDAESAAWQAGDAAWLSAHSEGSHPQPKDDAAAAAAATAEACCSADSAAALTAAANTAIEVVVTAAVGIEAANAYWTDDWKTLTEAMLQRYRQAEAQERAWQVGQASQYISLNSENQ